MGTISSQLSLHHSVVRRVLFDAGLPRAAAQRASKLDEYLPLVISTWEGYIKKITRDATVLTEWKEAGHLPPQVRSVGVQEEKPDFYRVMAELREASTGFVGML